MSVCQYITNCWWPTETSLDFSTFASALLIFFTAQKRRERTQLDGGYIKKLNRRGARAHKKKCPNEPEKGDWPETPSRSSRRFPNGRIFLQSKKCTIKSRVFLGFVFFNIFCCGLSRMASSTSLKPVLPFRIVFYFYFAMPRFFASFDGHVSLQQLLLCRRKL